MNINDNKPTDLIRFSYIEPGTVFRYGEGYSIYMRIDTLSDKDGKPKNAVNLSSGKSHCFQDNSLVEMLANACVTLYENND